LFNACVRVCYQLNDFFLSKARVIHSALPNFDLWFWIPTFNAIGLIEYTPISCAIVIIKFAINNKFIICVLGLDIFDGSEGKKSHEDFFHLKGFFV
jgi:hypothetical protein